MPEVILLFVTSLDTKESRSVSADLFSWIVDTFALRTRLRDVLAGRTLPAWLAPKTWFVLRGELHEEPGRPGHKSHDTAYGCTPF